MFRNRCFCLVFGLLLLSTVAAPAQEAKLLAVLRSDAGVEAKADACRQLARVATKDAVAPLGALLADETLSHMARYALETLRDPSVDDLLCDSLGKVPARPRLGVIGSLGVRRTAKAVALLEPLLKADDAPTAQAASRALGRIGTPAAAAALHGAVDGASAANRGAILEGLLRCAEALAIEGQAPRAEEIYDGLGKQEQAPPHVKAAALRGLVLLRGDKAIDLLVAALRGPDQALAAAAVRASMELKSNKLNDALLAELPAASPSRRGLLMLTLADRGDARVVPAVIDAVRGSDPALQIIGIQSLRRVGGAAAVPALFEVAASGSPEVSAAARETLAVLPGDAVDQQVIARLSQAQGAERLAYIDLARRRRTRAAAPALWTAAGDAEAAVRTAALAALGTVVDTAELPQLVARLVASENDADAAALEGAVRDVALRAANSEAATVVAAALPSAATAMKGRLLGVLSAVGGAKALEIVGAAARSDDDGLRDAAYRVLGQWKSSDAAGLLMELHAAANDDRMKTRAIRAYIRIARQFDLTDEVRAEMCRTALRAAARPEDQRLVLEVLLRYPSDAMQSVAQEAAAMPALKDSAPLIAMAMAQSKGARAEIGKALAEASSRRVKLEIVQAEFGADGQNKDVTELLRGLAKDLRVLFLPSLSYNKAFGGDPAPGKVKQLKIKYRIDGKPGEVSLNENAPVVLPLPK